MFFKKNYIYFFIELSLSNLMFSGCCEMSCKSCTIDTGSYITQSRAKKSNTEFKKNISDNFFKEKTNVVKNDKNNIENEGNNFNDIPNVDKRLQEQKPIKQNDFSKNNIQNTDACKYQFSKVGLNNIGSTCYMNATLQCLLHVGTLVKYFIDEYPNDCDLLKNKNKNTATKGELSEAFYNLVSNVYTTKEKSIFPSDFKETLGRHNPQFRRFEANDSKDLILYLLQTMHEELNYHGDNAYINIKQPDQLNRCNTFTYFNQTYNWRNFSIFSRCFYGTFENITKCLECQSVIYNFQKFEFISFGLCDYHKKNFNILEGFEDNEKPQKLTGDNQYRCGTCKKLCDAVIVTKIILPPQILVLNLDYGKNKIYQPNKIDFDETIDITKFVNFDFGALKYNIIGVCTHLGSSGNSGHYIAYCKDKTGTWYEFNDSTCSKCNTNNISTLINDRHGSPYLLIYEKVN